MKQISQISSQTSLNLFLILLFFYLPVNPSVQIFSGHAMASRCDLLADCTAEWLSSMEALRKDLVRSVPAHCALHCFGAALRGQMGQSASNLELLCLPGAPP